MVDFYRNVHCLMGLAIDAMSLPEAAQILNQARASRERCFFSTPNLNFVITSQRSASFRDSVSLSDLSLADGMPLVWVAKLLGVPLKGRVSGSSLFEFLRQHSTSAWNVFFFGGAKGVGQEACLAVGGHDGAMRACGYIYPGFVDVTDMSRPDLIDSINATLADFLVVSLGAVKGQDWICKNMDSLNVPVVAHLGAVINFVAGTVKRAPAWMQQSGLEWIWRMMQERSLVRRYVNDGLAFLRLLFTQVIPLAILQCRFTPQRSEFLRATIYYPSCPQSASLGLRGAWHSSNLDQIRHEFFRLTNLHNDITINMSDVTGIDSAFIGLLLLLEMALKKNGCALQFTGIRPNLARQIRLSGAAHLMKREL